jgi:hypothetical protein
MGSNEIFMWRKKSTPTDHVLQMASFQNRTVVLPAMVCWVLVLVAFVLVAGAPDKHQTCRQVCNDECRDADLPPDGEQINLNPIGLHTFVFLWLRFALICFAETSAR